jgi:hypothetical protein
MSDCHENGDIDEASDPGVRLRAFRRGCCRGRRTAFRLVVTELRKGGMPLLIVHFENEERAVGAYSTWDTHRGEYKRALFAGRSARGSVDLGDSG